MCLGICASKKECSRTPGDRGFGRQTWVSEGRDTNKISVAGQGPPLASSARAWMRRPDQLGSGALKKPGCPGAKFLCLFVSADERFNEAIPKGQDCPRVNS